MNKPVDLPSALIPSQTTLDLLSTLIAFPTVSRDSNLGLIEWVRDYLSRLGADVRLTYDSTGAKANLFATLGEGPKAGLVLSGHTDVVPVDGQHWATDPFRATIEGGNVYGRGSADMKGFIAAALGKAPRFLDAMRAGTLDAPLHYALSYDEEVGCLGVHGLVADLAEQGIKPGGCIVGEPTSMTPVTAHKGKRDMRCRVHGREAHSALTPLGVNAIDAAARLIVQIRHLADRYALTEARDYGFPVPYTTLSTNMISGGITTNVIPKDCEFMFEYRWLPGTDADGIEREIRSYADALLPAMRRVAAEADIRFEVMSDTPHLDNPADAEIVKLAEALSRNTARAKVAYGTEAGIFHRAGIPTVVIGPGSINVAHRPDEFVELEQLAQCEAFLERIARLKS